MTKDEFFDKEIEKRADICAYHFNDVYMSFEETFFPPEATHKQVMRSFKKHMRRAEKRHKVEIIKGRLDQFDRQDTGMRNMWTLVYKPTIIR